MQAYHNISLTFAAFRPSIVGRRSQGVTLC
jgi:hypothetical protein